MAARALTAVWLLLPELLAATAGPPPADRRPTPRFVGITHEQGLSDDTVEAVVQDHRGFIWFGTQDGLNRYDGSDFVVYRHHPEDPGSLSRSYVTSLYEDRGGDLWIGTLGGVNRYDRASDTFVRYAHDEDDQQSLNHDTVSAIYEDRGGDLWVGTYLGLNRLERSSGTFVRYSPDAAEPRQRLPAANVRSIVEDLRGFLWIGTEGNGLFRLDRSTGSVEHFRHDPADPASLCHDEVWDLLVDRRGRLWVGTRGGLDRLDSSTGLFLHFVHDPEDPDTPGGRHVDDLLQDRYGQLWIGYDGAGLDRFEEADGTFVHFRSDASEPSSLIHDVVRAIYEDSRGDLWIGTYTGGVSFLNQDHPFFYHRHRPGDPDSLVHSAVLSFFEDTDGSLWIGTEGGLNHHDPRTGKYRAWVHDERDPRSLAANAVLSILRDRRGDLWVGAFFGGLNRFEPPSETFTRYLPDPRDPGSLGNPHVWDIVEDRAGRLWLATFEGVERFDPETETFTHFRHDSGDDTGIGSSFVWKIYEDRSGYLWMATQDGLSVYDPAEDRFRTFGRDAGLPVEQVLTLFEDRRGVLWLGLQGGGLARFDRGQDGGSFTVFGTGAGLPGGVVYCLLGDDDGLLWLSTSDGLSRFDPDDATIVNYDESDGILAEPFSKNACLHSTSGEFYFGGGKGFMSFFPETVEPDPIEPPIVLTELEIFNRPAVIGGPGAPIDRHVSEAEVIHLRHDQSVLSISYAALNYRAPHRNQYAYMLEGFDKDWHHVGGKRTATYTNLDPGRYTFRVMGSNHSGSWNQEGAAIDVVIEPPLWGTWWAWGLYVLTVSAITLGFVSAHHRLQQAVTARTAEVEKRGRLLAQRQQLIGELEARNSDLARLNYTLSHELKTPLVTLHNFLGIARRDAAAGYREGLEQDFDRLEEAATRMYRQLEELYEFSRLDRLTLPSAEVELGEAVREIVDEISDSVADREIEIRVDDRLPTVRGDRARLLEMLRHLVDNAVAAVDGQASPRIDIGRSPEAVKDGQSAFFVRDNGIGIDPRYHERIFEIFERLDPTTSRGTGIGLALVKRIAELHRGRIWVESAGQGHGATFYFTLPVAAEPARDA